MRVREPRRPLIVEDRQRPAGKLVVKEARWVQPAVAELDEASSRDSDSLALFVCWPRKRERLERRCRRVSRAGFELGTLSESPQLMEPRMEEAERAVGGYRRDPTPGPRPTERSRSI